MLEFVDILYPYGWGYRISIDYNIYVGKKVTVNDIPIEILLIKVVELIENYYPEDIYASYASFSNFDGSDINEEDYELYEYAIYSL